MSIKLSELVGKVLIGHEVSNDNEDLYLSFKDGTKAHLQTDGDCCSHTWIESVDAPQNLRGKVLSIEEIDMPDLGNIPTSKQESVDQVSYYGLKIVTEHGHCVIDYRNDSNGYYGGSLNLVEVTPPGGADAT
jgi:hypothetical protein